MKYNMSTICKMNEFLGRDRNAFMTQELADATYPEWRKAIEAEDEQRYADALETAPHGSYVVKDTWSRDGKTLRKGTVVYIYDTRNIYGHIMICTSKSRQAMVWTCGKEELSKHSVHINRNKENTMKDTKKQPTRDEVIERGEYLGCTEYASGCTEQRWILDGIVFAETCNADGYSTGFRCLGKASKVLK